MTQLAIHHLPKQVQQVLPVLENLSISEKDFLIDFLNLSKKPTTQPPKNLSRPFSRLGQHKGMMTMRDDFNEYLGDDFWLGESHD